MKSSKKWVITFLSMIIAVLAFIMVVNYFVDPFGYFRFQGGNYFELNDDYYTRVLKAERIDNFADDYNAYIIGGSKASGVRAEAAGKIDGYNYYNTYIQSGNFEEYEKYIKYIFDNDDDVKKIFLHLSSIEVKAYSRQSLGDTYKTPAQVNGSSKIKETFKMLFKNLNVSWEELEKIRDNKTNPVAYPELATGERNLGKYYDAVKLDPKWFKERYVMTDYASSLGTLFNTKRDQTADMEKCLASLKRIKALCDSEGVQLQVVFGPSFISEMSVFDGPQFWNYYGEVVNTVGDVWDFSDYNEIMLNPYNFYNNLHFFYDVGDLMLATMASQKEEYKGADGSLLGHFGYHVYADASECEANDSELSITLVDYLKQREKAYYELKDEYQKTGTIALNSYEDISNIVDGSPYFEAKELKASKGRDDSVKSLYEKTKNKYDYSDKDSRDPNEDKDDLNDLDE